MFFRALRIAASSGVLMLAGCSSVQSTFDAHGPASHSIGGLSWFMTILFLVISVIMWMLVGFAFYRRRGSLATHEPIDAGGGQMWIAIGGIAIPLLVLTVLFVFELLRGGTLVQMVCPTIPDQPPLDDTIAPMEAADIPEMVALADITEPGPFRHRTAKLGGFLGIRLDGRLAAMAGQRLSATGFAEMSAVCTHPDFRGRGYAQALVAAVTRNIRAEGRTPFLTSLEANTGAVRIYQRVGFVVRRTFQLAVLKPPLPAISE